MILLPSTYAGFQMKLSLASAPGTTISQKITNPPLLASNFLATKTKGWHMISHPELIILLGPQKGC
ncbi:hypothetical protein A4F89_11195 [Polynucleobacter asymbioticus]|uniref:Uncharacterized protein n=1 Tax=Polynucleobacter asymbioticus TaxID=576611 RepID=A0AAC9NJB2_9BURK|nr:hypothetical protein A4F89_11195 [Polynucleobacter asymbioticus]APC02157.1 hypothetical protein AOC25_11280 [Polynucleobacter asymbioticus]